MRLFVFPDCFSALFLSALIAFSFFFMSSQPGSALF